MVFDETATLFRGTGEEDEVAVRVFDDEGLGLPRLVPQKLRDGHACRLTREKELLDLVRAGKRDGGGEQGLAFADVLGKDWLVNGTQGQARIIAADLRVERRIAVDEIDDEATLCAGASGRTLRPAADVRVLALVDAKRSVACTLSGY